MDKLIIILALASLACGAQALPTQTPESVNKDTHINTSTQPATQTSTAVMTVCNSGGLNIRPEAGDLSRSNGQLEDGDQITVGEIVLDVLHCPGHTPGHIVLFQPQARLAFVGDVLFKDSIGRTDFPRGNHADLIDSIRTKLWPLGDDDVIFIPGHGPESSFGRERRGNPFVGDAARFR